jgi:hypothetical protein
MTLPKIILCVVIIVFLMAACPSILDLFLVVFLTIPAGVLEPILPAAIINTPVGSILSPLGIAIVYGPLIIALFCIFSRLRNQCQREQETPLRIENDVINLWNGGSLAVEQSCFEQKHDGDLLHKITFIWDNKQYHWASEFTPIAIQPDKTDIYIVVFDSKIERAKYTAGRTFRIFINHNGNSWNEINPAAFPKLLAIQNTGLRGTDERDIVSRMDPRDPWFRRSLTAKLWSFLDNPSDIIRDELPKKFVMECKAKWIQAITAGKNGS